MRAIPLSILFALSSVRAVKMEHFARQRKLHTNKKWSPMGMSSRLGTSTEKKIGAAEFRILKLSKDDAKIETPDLIENSDEQLVSEIGEEDKLPLVQAPSQSPLPSHPDTPSSVPSLAPPFNPEGYGGFYVCDSSVEIDPDTVYDNTVNYFYNLTLEPDQNEFLPFVSTIEEKLLEAVTDSICNSHRQRRLATVAAISRLPADFSVGSCGKHCETIAGQMTVRVTLDGSLGYGYIYCAVLQVVHEKMQSGTLVADTKGIMALDYVPDFWGMDERCELTPDPSTSGGGDDSSKDRGLSSGAIAGISVTLTTLAVLLMGLFYAKRYFSKDACEASETGNILIIQTLATDPSGDIPDHAPNCENRNTLKNASTFC